MDGCSNLAFLGLGLWVGCRRVEPPCGRVEHNQEGTQPGESVPCNGKGEVVGEKEHLGTLVVRGH